MPLAWNDLRGLSVGVLGVGAEGLETAYRLNKLGIPFQSFTTDSRENLAELLKCQVVITSPGIPKNSAVIRNLVKNNTRVVTGLDLWLHSRDSLENVVLVSGTKGKSTTSALLCELLKAAGKTAFLCGNVGTPPWGREADSLAQEPDFWVVETSSYQAANLTMAAPLVIITSLSADHLTWHGSLQNYYEDKLSICTKYTPCTVIANGDSQELKKYQHLMGSDVRWVSLNDKLASELRPHLNIFGEHNVRNALLAVAALSQLGVKLERQKLYSVLQNFRSLRHRLEVVGSVGAVVFVDDTLSTNCLSTIEGIHAIKGPLALLLGGADRGIDYDSLAKEICDRLEATIVVTMPENGARIAKAITDRLDSGNCHIVALFQAVSLSAAVAVSFQYLSGSGGTVLLSPAAPSFGSFRNYKEKGDCFRSCVEELNTANLRV